MASLFIDFGKETKYPLLASFQCPFYNYLLQRTIDRGAIKGVAVPYAAEKRLLRRHSLFIDFGKETTTNRQWGNQYTFDRTNAHQLRKETNIHTSWQLDLARSKSKFALLPRGVCLVEKNKKVAKPKKRNKNANLSSWVRISQC